jgi:hypothetical protein
MPDFQIEGQDEIENQLQELNPLFAQLNGPICELRFDPTKPEQVQSAIQTTEKTVDQRLSEFSDDPLVQQLAAAAKEKIKAEILKRASDARRKLALNAIPFDHLNNSALPGGMASTPLKACTSPQPIRRRTF